MTVETIISIFLGIGLSASVGFRVFLPLFSLSLAAYFNFWELNESWAWLGSLTAVLTFGIATMVEIIAYYIPFIDNALDSIAIPLATIAGVAIMVSTISDLDPLYTWVLAVIAGGGTAATVASSSGITRLTSTSTTAGAANPIVSTIETVLSFVMSAVSIFIPVLAFVLVLVIFFIIFRLYKKIRASKP